MNSINSGVIFLVRLGQELSRNAFVVPIALFRKKLSTEKDFVMHSKSEIFYDFSKFRQECQEAFRKLLGCF